MSPKDEAVFKTLLNATFLKCFGRAYKIPISEVEGKHLANVIQEQTGLIIGWKSLKNYSQYLLNDTSSKDENPSPATLDTLARYVLDAPVTNEVSRKTNESHYPYWFKFRNNAGSISDRIHSSRRMLILGSVIAGIVILMIIIRTRPVFDHDGYSFSDDFNSLHADSLRERGWFVVSVEPGFWNRRDVKDGFLALYTLRGDNWPDTTEAKGIKNLVLRKNHTHCFIAEVRLKDFIPTSNWQQAGILILEDTNFTGKSARMSLAYNDYFGGFTKPGEIFIQVITSLGTEFSKPEEISHNLLFEYNGAATPEMKTNLKNSALRIEMNGKNIRFLYSGGEMDNSAFREIAQRDFEMEPDYIGIFALKGFVADSLVIPAYFDLFTLTGASCK